jgi:PAS domain S-box-containing protein
MNASQKKIIKLESTIRALEELLSVSEGSFLEELKKFEEVNEELKASIRKHEKLENDIKQILDASNDAIRVVDMNYNIIYASKSFRLLHGHSEDIIGRKCYEFVSEEECFTEKCSLKRIIRTRKKFTREVEIESVGGTKVPCNIDVIPYTDSEGKLIGIIQNYRNVTEQKQAEEKNRRINAIQNLILENSTLGISLVRNRVFEWANARVGELLMLSLEKIQGASTRIIYPSDESYEELGRIAYPTLTSGERSDNTLQLKRSDGTLFWCRFIGKALDSTKVNDGSVWMFEDITEAKQAQKIAEENAQQRGRIEMANNMLHDIGNAMTGISAHVLKPQMGKKWQEVQSLGQLRDMLASNEQEIVKVFGKEKQQALGNFMNALISSFEKRNTNHLEFLEKMSAAVGHVCSVLDLQRHYLREDASPLATKINLSIIINDALVMMSGSLQKRSIQVSLNAGGRKQRISGDQTRLIRVFVNIIKNTCEAFDEVESQDNRKLEISITPDESKKEIKVVFLDNAIGFSPKISKELFKRGFTTKFNGSGIGLHECRSIIESHGGTTTIESNGINTGALTVIKLPLLK